MASKVSNLIIADKTVFVFDLDDTLYKEIDFVVSGFKAVSRLVARQSSVDVFPRLMELFNSRSSNRSPNAFDTIIEEFKFSDFTAPQLLEEYRYHHPEIYLIDKAKACLTLLNQLGIQLGLLTDGRSKTQRNKINALGIADIFSHIVISEEFGSEKPDPRNYSSFEQQWPGHSFIYIADNPKKDFLSPNALGWQTVCLIDDGRNIHPQNTNLDGQYLARISISHFSELIGQLE